MKPLLKFLSFGIVLSFATALVPQASAQAQHTTAPPATQTQPQHPKANGAAKGAAIGAMTGGSAAKGAVVGAGHSRREERRNERHK
jgi:hypothetical protein